MAMETDIQQGALYSLRQQSNYVTQPGFKWTSKGIHVFIYLINHNSPPIQFLLLLGYWTYKSTSKNYITFFNLYSHVIWLTALVFVDSPKYKSRGDPREISRQILLGLCSSTREAGSTEERKVFCTGSELALLGCFYELGTNLVCRKRWAFWKKWVLKKVGLLDFSIPGSVASFPAVLPGNTWTVEARLRAAYYRHPTNVKPRSTGPAGQ